MPKDMVQVRRPKGNAHQAPSMKLGRSQIPLSHQHKTTFDAGGIIPYFVTEVVPGDTMTVSLMAFARIFSPLDAPIMDNIEMAIDFFFVPNRLVWDNWENFLGAHDQAGFQDVNFTIPILTSGLTVVHSSLESYMGLPIGLATGTEDVNSLPFRCYNLIYNQWYRDQSLLNEINVNRTNGPDANGDYVIRKSAKKHDYFTSALPYLQKGAPVTVSLGTSAPVTGDMALGGTLGVESTVTGLIQQIDTGAAQADLSGSTTTAGFLLYADLSAAAGITINALREAAAIQRLLERDARGGTRHPELIRAHFGVTVPDHRTQRPEYLGGGRGFINVSPISNTSSTASEDQGELRGIGTGVLQASWAKSFVEHGYVLGLLRARGEISYQQGLERMWSRSTKYDFLWPELAQLGEQAIFNRELWIEGDSTDDDIFGYQERYADYRFKKSLITGKFASDATGSLDFWHIAEDFASQPALNQVFIEDQTPMARVTTVDSEPDFIIDGRFEFNVARVLPVRPVPTLAPARF